jgi:XTP/dITP diphosphohydrolase
MLEGEILDSPRGQNGFGYDPIVHIPQLKGTLAQFESEIICSQGFRAKAAKKLFTFLKNY